MAVKLQLNDINAAWLSFDSHFNISSSYISKVHADSVSLHNVECSPMYICACVSARLLMMMHLYPPIDPPMYPPVEPSASHPHCALDHTAYVAGHANGPLPHRRSSHRRCRCRCHHYCDHWCHSGGHCCHSHHRAVHLRRALRPSWSHCARSAMCCTTPCC